MKLNFKILVIIVAVFTLLTRFIALSSIPPHLSNDEISIVYDAYSVSKTLRDEHNHFLPLSFQSHSTYKAPLTAYLTIPSILIFGNSDFAARAPSAFLGSLTVLILGLLVFELSKNKYLSLLTSFILAISPYHILTSRMAYEPNIALFFFCLGLYLFFLSLRVNINFFILGSYIFFALSLYSYHTEWVFTPLIIALLLILNYKEIPHKRIYYFGILVFLILVSPLFIDYLNNLHTTARANTELLLKEPSLAIKLEDPNFLPWQKTSFILQAFLDKYSSYLNLSYIFFTGLNLQPSSDPFQVGLFLSPFLPFLFIGIFKLKEVFLKNSKFLYVLLLTSPLIPALTEGTQSHSRNLVSVIPISIISSVGIFVFWKTSKKVWKIVFVSLLTVSFLYFLVIFYYHFPKDSGEGYQYGYKQIALFIKPRYQRFEQIVIDPRFGDFNMYSGLPHLYIPYFTNLDPHKLLESRRDTQGTFFDKYQIRDINWNIEKLAKNTLYVVPVSNIPYESLHLKKVYEVILPNSKPAFNLYTLED